jgi:hypothetical protein
MAEALILDAIQKGLFPNTRVNSGALSQRFYKAQPFQRPNSLVLEELLRRGHNISGLRVNSLNQCGITNDTDLVFFVNSSLMSQYLYDHLEIGVRPRSMICINLFDPSRAPDELTMKEQISQTYDILEYLIHNKLLGIIFNDRKGGYNIHKFNNRGIILPFKDQLTRSNIRVKGEFSSWW